MTQTELVGVEAAFRDLKRVTGRIVDAADLEAQRAAERLVSLVVPRVPKVSGALAGSLTADDAGDGAVAGYDGTVAYAGYIEFGGFHGRPYVAEGRYLWPAGDDAEAPFVAALNTAAESEIRRYSWSNPRP